MASGKQDSVLKGERQGFADFHCIIKVEINCLKIPMPGDLKALLDHIANNQRGQRKKVTKERAGMADRGGSGGGREVRTQGPSLGRLTGDNRCECAETDARGPGLGLRLSEGKPSR